MGEDLAGYLKPGVPIIEGQITLVSFVMLPLNKSINFINPLCLTPRRCLNRRLLFLCLYIMKTFKSKLREVTAVYKTTCPLQNVKITNSKDVNELIRKIYPVEINIREAMVVLYLNNSNRTLGYGVIGIGGFTATLVDIRIILRDAFLTQCTGIILIHNHPSGSLTPSEADMNITDKIKKAAGIMDIRLLDHLILTENSYYSFIEHAKL